MKKTVYKFKSDKVNMKDNVSEKRKWKMMTKKPVKLKKLDVIEHRKKKNRKLERSSQKKKTINQGKFSIWTSNWRINL